MGSPRERNGREANWISTELSRKMDLVMKRKRPKLVVLDLVPSAARTGWTSRRAGELPRKFSAKTVG